MWMWRSGTAWHLYAANVRNAIALLICLACRRSSFDSKHQADPNPSAAIITRARTYLPNEGDATDVPSVSPRTWACAEEGCVCVFVFTQQPPSSIWFASLNLALVGEQHTCLRPSVYGRYIQQHSGTHICSRIPHKTRSLVLVYAH